MEGFEFIFACYYTRNVIDVVMMNVVVAQFIGILINLSGSVIHRPQEYKNCSMNETIDTIIHVFNSELSDAMELYYNTVSR